MFILFNLAEILSTTSFESRKELGGNVESDASHLLGILGNSCNIFFHRISVTY